MGPWEAKSRSWHLFATLLFLALWIHCTAIVADRLTIQLTDWQMKIAQSPAANKMLSDSSAQRALRALRQVSAFSECSQACNRSW